MSQKSDGRTQVLLCLPGADVSATTNVVLGRHCFAVTAAAFRLAQVMEASA
ncbi:hypothetical protein G6M04_28315 [Agrobacterium rhizogenes]|uniref:hypothetical protein n=1 Tax=Rhizobium rhizogenes TaxID=359 RepID=UPI001574B39B|nr:hypothetical protein [Rhizobium rhizogenes]NTG51309.1 hypothetical protein [Rhizobium rhizogenes]